MKEKEEEWRKVGMLMFEVHFIVWQGVSNLFIKVSMTRNNVNAWFFDF